jgi:monovalent cation:H+ antiporter-2, CPA2 family
MKTCNHLEQITDAEPLSTGCMDCLLKGDRWVHLRMCMLCGYVGCCDSSPNKHMTEHFHSSGHMLMRSLEPGENWGWCYSCEVMLTQDA